VLKRNSPQPLLRRARWGRRLRRLPVLGPRRLRHRAESADRRRAVSRHVL